MGSFRPLDSHSPAASSADTCSSAVTPSIPPPPPPPSQQLPSPSPKPRKRPPPRPPATRAAKRAAKPAAKPAAESGAGRFCSVPILSGNHAMSQLAALEGTPLGKLLQAAPDVKVGGHVIPWNRLGLSLLATWQGEQSDLGAASQLADTCQTEAGRLPHVQGGAERGSGILNGVSGNGFSLNGFSLSGFSGNGVLGNGVSGNGISGNGVFQNGVLGNDVATSNGVLSGEAFGNRIFSNGFSQIGFSQNGVFENGSFQPVINSNGVSGISGNRVSGNGIPGVSENGVLGNDISENKTVLNGISGISGNGVEGSSSCSSTGESSGNQKFLESCPGKIKSSEVDEEGEEEEEEGLLTLSLGPISNKGKIKKGEKCSKRGTNVVSENEFLKMTESPAGTTSTSVGGVTEESAIPRTVTENDMERLYGNLYGPVLVSDEDQRLLWSNRALQKAASELEKKSTSAFQVHGGSGVSGGGRGGDFLKSLVPVERLLFCSSPIGPPQKAVLWEFLQTANSESKPETKKEFKSETKTETVGRAISTHRTSFSAYDRSSVKGAMDKGRESSTISGDCFVFSAEVAQKVRMESSGHLPGSGVICPQPVRSIGSCISVKNFRSVPGFASPMVGTFESVQFQFDDLDRWSAPVVTTDKIGRVRWVNTAYKLLTRQPKCPWMASTFGRKDEVSSARLVGEVVLTGLEDLPRTAVTVLCAAEISYFSSANGNGKQIEAEKSVVQIPALVTRLDSPEGSILGYVFHFDTTSVGLRLMNGA